MLTKNLFKHLTYQVFSPQAVVRQKYESFKSLLDHDKTAHEHLAELEEIYYRQVPVDWCVIEKRYDQFSQAVAAITDNLAGVYPTRYTDLKSVFRRFDSYVRFMLSPDRLISTPPYAAPLRTVAADQEKLFGAKAVNLSTIGTKLGLPIPNGFAISANAFNHLIDFNRLREKIDNKLAQVDIRSPESIERTCAELIDLILTVKIPAEVEDAITETIHNLWPHPAGELTFAVRSSAVGEDSRGSFAGQYRSLLNITPDKIIDAYLRVIASKYSPGALVYRINYGLADAETPMAVLVVEMIDAAASGVVYTQDINDSRSDRLSIHAVRGLGELLVAGEVTPDIVVMEKGDPCRIVAETIRSQTAELASISGGKTALIPVASEKQHEPVLTKNQALTLGSWGQQLETYWKTAQDIEWCRDKEDHLYLLQARPLQDNRVDIQAPPECDFHDIVNEVLISDGETASAGIGAGPVCRVGTNSELNDCPQGAILVARDASPKYSRLLNRLTAVVTEKGSAAGHFASVAREFGIPVIVNARDALTLLEQGAEVTVHADGCRIYRGAVAAMLESPCARRNLLLDGPFMRRLDAVMGLISTLRLIDPAADNFKPEGCRSLHDIVRFAHEKAIQAMLDLGNRKFRKVGGSRKLKSGIPMYIYVLDVGGGFKQGLSDDKTIDIDDITSDPMLAVFKGLRHPNIQWSEFSHFDWAEHDKIVMSGGIISPESAMFASHAVISADYANLNLRFGYHFVIVDTACGDQPDDNYILFRFSGGGADIDKRLLRAKFLSTILYRLDFEVTQKSDLIDARFTGADREMTLEKLDMLGRLLGAARLMDMYLRNESMVAAHAEAFMNGRYHFGGET
jgi:pyruvate,water dikinase